MMSSIQSKSANSDEQPILLSPKEAAMRLRISERTLWTITDRGEIQCIRIGASKRYPITELERFVASKLLEKTEVIANSSVDDDSSRILNSRSRKEN